MGAFFRGFFVSILFSPMCLQVVSELSASYASLVDVIGMSANVTYNDGEAERVHALSKHWAESMTHVLERNRYKNKVCACAVCALASR